MREIRIAVFVSFNFLRITPACAGNTIKPELVHRLNQDHPRMCGKYLWSTLGDFFSTGSPPHVREILALDMHISRNTRITPACAGNTLLVGKVGMKAQDHPRMCGKYFDRNWQLEWDGGSPPHVREILL